MLTATCILSLKPADSMDSLYSLPLDPKQSPFAIALGKSSRWHSVLAQNGLM